MRKQVEQFVKMFEREWGKRFTLKKQKQEKKTNKKGR